MLPLLCFGLVDKLGLTIDEIDVLTGPIIGRPKSATFRTADVVGIDTLVKVAKGVADNCKDHEAISTFTIPTWLEKIVENNWLGDKSKQGFFKKIPRKNDRRLDLSVYHITACFDQPTDFWYDCG